MHRRARGSLEDQVLDAVARAAQPVSVAEVMETLGDATAYTTAMTTLARLHDKGMLVRERRGRAFVYSPAAAPESLPAARAARQMRRLLEGHGTRADVLARFVAELDTDDEALLLGLLADTTSTAVDDRMRHPGGVGPS